MTDNPLPGMITVREAEEILQAKLKEFAGDKRGWAEASMSLCKRAAGFLLESLEKSDGSACWDGSSVTYKYAVCWDWQSRKEQGRLARPEISEQDLLNKDTFVQKVDQYIFDQAACAVLDWLAQSTGYWIGFGNKYPVDQVREFNIKALKDIGIPHTFLLYDSKHTPIGGVAFCFLPLVSGGDSQSAFFPIEVGVIPFIEKHHTGESIATIVNSTRIEWARVFASILPECEETPVFLEMKSGAIRRVRIDPLQLQEFVDTLQDRFVAIVRNELLNALKAHEIAPPEDGEPTIPIARPIDTHEEENTFRKVGDYWEITYQGERRFLKDTNGVCYIAYLLAYPGRTFPSIELVAAVKHNDIETVGDLGEGSAPNDEILDGQSKIEYQARLRELAQDRSRAEKDNDIAWLSAVNEETLKIQEALDAATGLGGRSRRTNSQKERARVNVTRQIKSAIKRIALENPALSSYLSSTIKTGYDCQYSPLPGSTITWTL